MADYLGSYNASTTVRFMFTTHAATGAPVAPNSAFEAADLIIYKDGSATQRTSANGVTMTSPFDSIVGLHSVSIDLSDNTDSGFYAAGSEYAVVLSPDETVDSLAVVKVLAYFSIERVVKVNVVQNAGTNITSSSGRQEVNLTHIAGSSVATGTAQLGVNVVNWNASAVTKNSSNYPEMAVRYWRDDSVSTTTALQGWLSVSTVTTSLGNNIITAASIASDAITDAKVASDVTIASVTGAVGSVTGAVGSVTGAVGSVTGNVGGNVVGTVASVVGAVGSVTGNVGGNVTGSVGSVATGGITAASIATDAIGSNELAASAIDEIVDAVWDELKSGHAVSGSYGEAASDWASQTDLADIATDVNSIQAEVTLIHDDTGTSGVVVNAAGLATDAVTEIVTAIFANAPAESYATDGAAPTFAQFQYMIWSALSQFSVSSTTITSKRLDGTTSAMTFTMDDATNPTSRFRAS